MALAWQQKQPPSQQVAFSVQCSGEPGRKKVARHRVFFSLSHFSLDCPFRRTILDRVLINVLYMSAFSVLVFLSSGKAGKDQSGHSCEFRQKGTTAACLPACLRFCSDDECLPLFPLSEGSIAELTRPHSACPPPPASRRSRIQCKRRTYASEDCVHSLVSPHHEYR